MTAKEVLKEMEALGKASYKKLLMKNYGVKEPCFGVSIGDMKKMQKRIKKDYQLALDLYDTGNYDAMYFAGLIADDERMTRKDLQRWADNAQAGSLSGATVPWVAAGGPHGHVMALKWIESAKPIVAGAGWATLSGLVAIKDDTELDLVELKSLIQRVQKTIHKSPDVVRYQMNFFIIAVGCYVKPLTDLALKTGEKIGPVSADLGSNSCEVFSSPDYIRKVQKRGTIGKKRKTIKC